LDPLVRITHWGIAAAVLLNGLILEGGDQPHVLVGYTALSLLALRLVWGLVGTEEARFTAFPPAPGAAFAHIGDILAGRTVRHRSHNPLGALMVYTLWAMLAVVIATGLAMENDVFPDAPERHAALAAEVLPGMVETPVDWDLGDGDHDEDEGEELLEEVHETAANLLLILALVHVGGVVFEMMPGRSRADPAPWRRERTTADKGPEKGPEKGTEKGTEKGHDPA
jgi:cytochrome b